MAIRRRQNWINQQRVDVPHIRSVESAVSNDFDELFASLIMGASNSYVVRGLELNMSGAVGNAATALQMIVANSAFVHGASNESGTFFSIASGTPSQTLNSNTNTKVLGSFTPSAINYVGIEFNRSVDNSTSSQIFLWNPTSKTEFPKNVPLAITLDYRIVITSSTWAANVLPIAVVETNGSNNVVAVEDRRPMMFRLGTGGSSTPNPLYTYPWTNQVEGRTENFWRSTSSQSPFRGGDKQILHFKEWADAIMSNIKEIKGTPYWYSENVGGSIIKLKGDVSLLQLTGSSRLYHNGINKGQVNWDQNLFLDFVGSRLSFQINTNPANTLDVDQIVDDEAETLDDVNTWISQGFIPTESADISQVVLRLANTGLADGNLVVQIYSDNAGEPDTLLGASKPVDASSINSSAAPYVFGFNTAIPLIAATQYHVVLNTASMTVIDASNAIEVHRANSDVLPGVTSNLTTDAGANWTDTSKDLYVQVYLNTGTDLILSDNEVGYLNLVRGVPVTPNLIFTNGSNIITSVGAQPWTTDLVPGDYVKVATDLDTEYYKILTVDSASQVTLTDNYEGASTGAVGIEAATAYGVYEVAAVPSTDRHIQVASREDVPFNEDVYWLFLRQDNGSSIAKVYVRNQGEIEQGESITIGDGVGQEILTYIGSLSETDSEPDYSAILAPNGSLQITNYNTSNGESLTRRAAKITAMLADIRQDFNIEFDAGDITWDGTDITVDNAYMSIPGTTIGAAPISINNLAATPLPANSCLYVDINRTTAGALTLAVSTLANLTPVQQRLVVLRNINGEILVR